MSEAVEPEDEIAWSELESALGHQFVSHVSDLPGTHIQSCEVVIFALAPGYQLSRRHQVLVHGLLDALID